MKSFKNKSDLQFEIMKAGDTAAAEVHETMSRHLSRADELWRLSEAALALGLTVRLPSMRWVNYPALYLLADSDEAEVAAQRVIEEWAAAESGRIDATLRDAGGAVFQIGFEHKGRILAHITREQMA